MQTDATSPAVGQTQAGSVVALWRYPVKSMMGEELNSSEVTDRGLLGDRQFAVVDRATGKVGGAKNPRKWGNFFDFRASYAEAPRFGGRVSPVRITLPDGEVVSNDRADLEQILSRAFGRDIAFVEARAEGLTSGVAEEYWPDMAGLEHRDTVTEFEMPAGTFFDIAVVHLGSAGSPVLGRRFGNGWVSWVARSSAPARCRWPPASCDGVSVAARAGSPPSPVEDASSSLPPGPQSVHRTQVLSRKPTPIRTRSGAEPLVKVLLAIPDCVTSHSAHALGWWHWSAH
jgi:hypothetical protein